MERETRFRLPPKLPRPSKVSVRSRGMSKSALLRAGGGPAVSLRPANRFGLSEWSGAVGDLGTLLPLAFALVIFNGYSPQRLFFLWGAVYMVTGWFYRVPVSVQPLKAMAVIAIAQGFSVAQLSSAGVFYGILLLVLALSGLVRWLERWFSPALIRGVQLGIGLILLQKAVQLSLEHGLYLSWTVHSKWFNLSLLIPVLLVLGIFQFQRQKPVSVWIIAGSILFSALLGVKVPGAFSQGALAVPSLPKTQFLFPAVVYLIVPQLPLTLGNAVFAACDACRTLWRDRAHRVSPTRLAFSIGLSDLFIGLLGGFPVCHGAGGIVAHAKFGGRTGGTTLLLGLVLVLVSVAAPLSRFLFLIPIPVLGALLLFTSWGMISLVLKLDTSREIGVALLVGGVSFFTGNLTIAILLGFAVEQGVLWIVRRKKIAEAHGND